MILSRTIDRNNGVLGALMTAWKTSKLRVVRHDLQRVLNSEGHLQRPRNCEGPRRTRVRREDYQRKPRRAGTVQIRVNPLINFLGLHTSPPYFTCPTVPRGSSAVGHRP